MEIGNIVQGHMNEILGLNKDLKQERLKICYACPIYSPRLGGICNSKLWLNPVTGDVSTVKKDGYVNGCSCRLNAKATLSAAHCPANKW